MRDRVPNALSFTPKVILRLPEVYVISRVEGEGRKTEHRFSLNESGDALGELRKFMPRGTRPAESEVVASCRQQDLVDFLAALDSQE